MNIHGQTRREFSDISSREECKAVLHTVKPRAEWSAILSSSEITSAACNRGLQRRFYPLKVLLEQRLIGSVESRALLVVLDPRLSWTPGASVHLCIWIFPSTTARYTPFCWNRHKTLLMVTFGFGSGLFSLKGFSAIYAFFF